MNLFWRFLLPILFLLITFWPDYGLAWLAWGFFPGNSYLVTILTALWAIAFSLILPLPIRVFRLVSTFLLIVAIGTATISGYSSGSLAVMTPQYWILFAIVVFGIILGWNLVATRIWRGIHSIVAVEDQHA